MDNSVTQPESFALPPSGVLMQLMGRPGPIITHPAWHQARDKILVLLHGKTRLIALLGPPGSGKTTLLRDLTDTLQRSQPVTYASEFSDMSAGLPRDGIVLVDEAERLSSEALAMLAGQRDLTVILTALPSFYGRFIEFRTGAVVSLPLLTQREARAFLASWMDEFGLSADALTPAAWERLIAYCRGVPRLLVSLLKLALFVAADEPASRVRLEHVETAITVQGGNAEASLAEIARVSAERHADQQTVAAAAAEPEDALEIPLPDPLLSTAEPPAMLEAPLVERSSPRRGRIAAWCAVAVLCVAGLGFALFWGNRRVPTDSSMLARNSAIEAPAPPPVVEPTPTPEPAPPTPAKPVVSPPPVAPVVTATAAAPAPTPTATQAALPSGASIRVVVTYARGDAAALQRSQDLARTLRANGVTVTDPYPVAQKDSQPSIRYYFAEDEGAAGAIASRLGADYGSPSRFRFSSRDGMPRPGTIEVDVGRQGKP